MPPIYEATELEYGTSYKIMELHKSNMELYRKFIELHKSVVEHHISATEVHNSYLCSSIIIDMTWLLNILGVHNLNYGAP